jgi:hypothetical protein
LLLAYFVIVVVGGAAAIRVLYHRTLLIEKGGLNNKYGIEGVAKILFTLKKIQQIIILFKIAPITKVFRLHDMLLRCT